MLVRDLCLQLDQATPLTPRWGSIAKKNKQPLPLVEVQVPASQEQQEQIASNERSQDPKIPPPLVISDIQRLVKLISNLVGTIPTTRSHIINNIPRSSGIEESTHILSTRLSSRSSKEIEFFLLAYHRQIMKFRRHQTGDETSERVKLIEPDAVAFRNLGVRVRDAAKEREDDDDEGVEEDSDEG